MTTRTTVERACTACPARRKAAPYVSEYVVSGFPGPSGVEGSRTVAWAVVSGFSLRVKYVVSGFSRTVATSFFVLALGGQVASAQSLGDVARREAERRKQTPAGRVYTNTDLAPVDVPAPSPAPVPVEAATGIGTPTPDTPAPGQEAQPEHDPGIEPIIVKASVKRDEQYWRSLARDLKARMAKVNANVATQEARLAGIDAGPQTPTAVREREVVSATLTRLQKDALATREGLTWLTTRAQLAKVPEEWIR